MFNKGHCLVSTDMKKTQYFWGPLTDIAGRILPVVDRNSQGDCLCMVEGKGLVDVHHDDVATFVESGQGDPQELMNQVLKAG